MSAAIGRAVAAVSERCPARLCRVPQGPDDGNAVVEFCVLGVLLLVPVVYLVLALARIEAGAFAAQRAAREAGRAFVTAPAPDAGRARAGAAAALALSDQGLEDQGRVQVTCAQPDCLAPDGQVTTSSRVWVVLPGVPRLLDQLIPARIEVTATQVTAVDRYRAKTRDEPGSSEPGSSEPRSR